MMTSTPPLPPTASSLTGSWTIDPARSRVSFVSRLLFSKVPGHFSTFTGRIQIADELSHSALSASVDVASISTGKAKRNEHLRSPKFFDVATFPTLTYTSTAIRHDGAGYVVDGDLTIHGVTQPVRLDVTAGSVATDASGQTSASFSATTAVSRRLFGVSAIPGIVGDAIGIELHIAAVRQA